MNIQNELKNLHDIYGLRHVPWWQTPIFYGIVATILSLLLIFGLYYVFKKIKARRARRTPWDRALDEVGVLKKYSSSPEHSKEFYYAVTLLLKNYLHERFGFDVQGKTDEELFLYLTSAAFPQELIDPLRTIFNGGLTVKFANAQAACDQMEYDLALTIMIIKKTIPSKK